MAFQIQRVPRGLAAVLNLFGGETPRELGKEIVGTLDLLQFYGQTQLSGQSASNAALAEGGTISINFGSGRESFVLFSLSAEIVKTATMTALSCCLELNRGAGIAAIVSGHNNLGPFGATETGTIRVGGLLPYPILCPSPSAVNFRLTILGTDATANCSLLCEFGVLG